MGARPAFYTLAVTLFTLWSPAGLAQNTVPAEVVQQEQQLERLPDLGCQALLNGQIVVNEGLLHQRAQMIENYWIRQFAQRNWMFEEMRINVFSGTTLSSAGGPITTLQGPIYDRGSKTINIDPAFLPLMVHRIGPPTDALATVMVAHETGHHIQVVRNSFEKGVRLAERASGGDIKKALDYFYLRIELQADCLAGVFFGYLRSQGLATNDQIQDAALRLALMGDDIQQVMVLLTTGQMGNPSYAHPNAVQRQEWFLRGANDPRLEVCEPFDEPILQ